MRPFTIYVVRMAWNGAFEGAHFTREKANALVRSLAESCGVPQGATIIEERSAVGFLSPAAIAEHFNADGSARATDGGAS